MCTQGVVKNVKSVHKLSDSLIDIRKQFSLWCLVTRARLEAQGLTSVIWKLVWLVLGAVPHYSIRLSFFHFPNVPVVAILFYARTSILGCSSSSSSSVASTDQQYYYYYYTDTWDNFFLSPSPFVSCSWSQLTPTMYTVVTAEVVVVVIVPRYVRSS